MFRATLTCFVLVAAIGAITKGGPLFAADDAKVTTIQLTPKKTKQEAPDEKTLQKAIQIIEQRLENARVQNARVKLTASKQIEITIPSVNATSIIWITSLVSRKGSLEFAILANRKDHAEIIAASKKSAENDVKVKGKIVASWKRVAVIDGGKLVDIGRGGDVATRMSKINDTNVRQFLVVHSKPMHRLSEVDLAEVRPALDANGRPAMLLLLSKKGAVKMEKLTADNRPAVSGFKRRLGVILVGRLMTAPSIVSSISGEVQIVGAFSPEKVMGMVRALNAQSALPFTFETINVKTKRKSQ